MGAAPGPGDAIGGFRLVKLIGRGAFGSVFEAEEQHGLGRRVAVKVLAGELAGDERYRRRFVAETRALAVVERHPNVVPVYGAGEDRGVLYIAMRLVDSDLRAVLAERGTLPPQLVATVVGQVAAALDYAHSMGFVHRDVKPANVLVEEPGGRLHCYVTDFGIASAPEPADSTTGGLGGPRGTYAYMAPEVIEARPSRDGQGDGYSLACVAHECLSGTAFFQRASEPATMMAQLKEKPPPLASELGLVAGVDTVLARELEKDPSRRYGTCSSFAEALGTELTRAPRPRHRARVALAMAIGVAVAAAGIVALVARGGGTPGTLPRWGSLQREPPLTVPSSEVAGLTVADLNGDGRQDVIVTRVERGTAISSPVSFLLDERGTFVDATKSLAGQDLSEVDPSGVIVGDLTGDGRTDVLLADAGGTEPRGGGETLLVGEGERFVSRPDLLPHQPAGARPRALAEINDGGQIDVFVDNAPGSARSELWYRPADANRGSPFQNVSDLLPEKVTKKSADYTAATFVAGPALILAPGAKGPALLHIEKVGARWFVGRGMPREPTMLGPHPTAAAIVATDLNDDGTPDVVVSWTRANGQGRYLQILIGEHGGTDYADQTSSLLPQKANRLAPIDEIRPVDLDGDGDVDLATVLRNGAQGAPMYRNVGRGDLRLLPASFSNAAGGEYAMVDHTGDGKRDLLVIRSHQAGDPQERSVLVPDVGRSLVPAAVPDLTGVSNPGAIHLSWPYVWGASSYRVYRSTRAFGRPDLIKTVHTTSWTDRPRRPGYVWYYQVAAGNGNGFGTPSAPLRESS